MTESAPFAAGINAGSSETARLASAQTTVLAADDRSTIVAFSVIAGFFGAILHEGLGHALVAWLQGAHSLLLTNCYLSSDISTRSIDAAGTLVNLAVGVGAWLVLRRCTVRSSFNFRYFLWLVMTLNLFDGTGYFCYSGVAGIGDWQEFIKDLHPYWIWRAGLAALGIVLYFMVSMPLSGRWLARLVAGGDDSKARLVRLTVLPYLTIGIAGTIAAIPNLLGWKLIVISAAAATFGGLFGFLYVRPDAERFLRKLEKADGNPGFVTRSGLVIAVAVLLFAVNVAVFGRGLAWQGNKISIATHSIGN